jgi:hypothetical protein
VCAIFSRQTCRTAAAKRKTEAKSVFLAAFLSVFRLWIMEATKRDRRGTCDWKRTARKSVLCTVLWTVLYSAQTQLRGRSTICGEKIPQKWTRASTSKGRERPPVLDRAAAPALRASGVAPALCRVQTSSAPRCPRPVGTNPTPVPRRFHPPGKYCFLRQIS